MYRVITLFGEDEPWWFFEDWEKDILTDQHFNRLNEAIAVYEELFEAYARKFDYVQIKKEWLAAFWKEGELRYCEDCDDDLQLYHSLMLLKGNKVLKKERKLK